MSDLSIDYKVDEIRQCLYQAGKNKSSFHAKRQSKQRRQGIYFASLLALLLA
jgi:hypothetical protein